MLGRRSHEPFWHLPLPAPLPPLLVLPPPPACKAVVWSPALPAPGLVLAFAAIAPSGADVLALAFSSITITCPRRGCRGRRLKTTVWTPGRVDMIASRGRAPVPGLMSVHVSAMWTQAALSALRTWKIWTCWNPRTGSLVISAKRKSTHFWWTVNVMRSGPDLFVSWPGTARTPCCFPRR